MKKFFTYIILVLFIYVSLPTTLRAQTPVGQDDSIGSEDAFNEVFPLGMKVYPKFDTVDVKPSSGKIGVLSATIPFFNEFGRELYFKVDFPTSTWTIDDVSGTLAGGVLTSDQHDSLKVYAVDRLKPDDQRLFKSTGLAIIAIIIGLVSLGFQYASYQRDIQDRNEAIIREERICAGNVITQTGMAIATGNAACPYKLFKNEVNGRLCTNVPEFRNADPQACRGMTFMGRCRLECN
jgi:hypothetical protein